MNSAYTTHTIDAAGKSLGRVASQAAKLLRGKADPHFENHVMPRVKVTITNASKIEVHPGKLEDKVYLHYSGYPGGQSSFKMKEMIVRKGYKGIFERAVEGMLPGNKLAKQIMKNLTVQD
jgi:large subunit ribosomal protein L13